MESLVIVRASVQFLPFGTRQTQEAIYPTSAPLNACDQEPQIIEPTTVADHIMATPPACVLAR